MAENTTISSVRFRNFKALREFSIALRHLNVLVGPNNAGKSTIIGAFRVLATAIRRARTRSPSTIDAGRAGTRQGYIINSNEIPISLENAHTDYADAESTVQFRLSNGDSFTLYFPDNGGCRM